MNGRSHPDALAGLVGRPMSRREAMRRGLLGAAGLVLADRLALGAPAARTTSSAGLRRMRVVHLLVVQRYEPRARRRGNPRVRRSRSAGASSESVAGSGMTRIVPFR